MSSYEDKKPGYLTQLTLMMGITGAVIAIILFTMRSYVAEIRSSIDERFEDSFATFEKQRVDAELLQDKYVDLENRIVSAGSLNQRDFQEAVEQLTDLRTELLNQQAKADELSERLSESWIVEQLTALNSDGANENKEKAFVLRDALGEVSFIGSFRTEARPFASRAVVRLGPDFWPIEDIEFTLPCGDPRLCVVRVNKCGGVDVRSLDSEQRSVSVSLASISYQSAKSLAHTHPSFSETTADNIKSCEKTAPSKL